MKNIILFTCLLLISVKVIAESYYIIPHWVPPTEREYCEAYDGNGVCITHTPLLPEDIAYFTSYNADCDTGNVTGVYTAQILPYLTKQFIVSDVPTMCLKYTVTDMAGRESRDSELFVLKDYNTPQSVECVP